LHPTDAGALAEIIYAEDRGAPISPAELSRRLALSKPALSACLNRLEEVGHIVRTRESVDRRVVTLRCDSRIYRHAEKFFVGISSRMASIVEKLSDQDVDLILSFLKDASVAVLEDDSTVE
jgi:DNA-binding MarR family transcriptional regulator